MARTIDGNAVKRRVWEIAEAWKDQGRDYEALLLESVVEQIVDTAPTLTPPNEWVSVEERLPEDADGMVLLTDGVAVQTGYRNQLVRMDGRSGVFVPKYRPSGGAMEVTHWMPLPTPPDRRPPEGNADA